MWVGWAPEQDWEEAQFAGQEKVLVWEFTVVLPRKHQFLMTVEQAEQRAFLVVLVVKNPPANSGDITDPGSIPRSGRCLEEGNGNPLQYSCLENPMDRGAWQATVHGVAESDMTEATACTHAARTKTMA